MLTVETLEAMYRNDEWLGFGYLGGRRNQIEAGGSVEEADAQVLAEANVQGMDAAELFEWANSKQGRWFADCIFGCGGQHSERYLPGQQQR